MAKGGSKAATRKRKAPPTAENEEIESDDEEIKLASEEEEEVDNESALTPEEKRLLLAQECLRKMGLNHVAADIEEAANLLAAETEEREKENIQSVAKHLIFAPPIVYKAVGHRATCLAVTADDATAYTGGKDCRIIQWDVETGQKVFFPGKAGNIECDGHFADVYDLSLAMNGRLLISGGKDEIIRLWDTRMVGKRFVGELRGHTGSVMCLGNAGDSIYSGSADKSLREWSLLTQRLVTADFGHTAAVTNLDVRERNKVLTCGEDGTVRYWNIEQSKHIILEQGGNLDSVALLGSGGAFASGSQEGQLSLWTLKKKSPLKSAELNKWISAIRYLPNTDCFFVGSDSGAIDVWEWNVAGKRLEKCSQSIEMHGIVADLKCSPKRNFLFAVSSKEPRLGRWISKKGTDIGLSIVAIREG